MWVIIFIKKETLLLQNYIQKINSFQLLLFYNLFHNKELANKQSSFIQQFTLFVFGFPLFLKNYQQLNRLGLQASRVSTLMSMY